MTLKIGVIGVGYHGRHHARVLSELPGVHLVGIADPNQATTAALAEQYRCRAFADHRDLLGLVDLVTIAAPTSLHAPIGVDVLRQGIACLVEKPLADTVEGARALVRLAERHRAVLQVGHIERFNPAWLAAEKELPRASNVIAQRWSRYPFRSLDVSVVHDVMIHDLELALSATGSTPVGVQASGRRWMSPSFDRVDAFVTFRNGATASLSASRVHHGPTRQITLSASSLTIEVDLHRRTTTICRAKESDLGRQAVDIAPQLALTEREPLFHEFFETSVTEHDRAVEPLRLELADFVECVRENREPRVTGERGLLAMQLAERICQRAESFESLPLRRSA